MSCNCKSGTNIPFKDGFSEETNKKSIVGSIFFYSFKIIGFSLALCILPFVMVMIAVYMFKIMVLSKKLDLKPLFTTVISFMKRANPVEDDDDDEEEEIEQLTEEDYITIQYDDLTKN